MITYKGETKCASDWAKETGISASAIRYRFKHGWGEDKIFSQPYSSATRKNSKKTRKEEQND